MWAKKSFGGPFAGSPTAAICDFNQGYLINLKKILTISHPDLNQSSDLVYVHILPDI